MPLTPSEPNSKVQVWVGTFAVVIACVCVAVGVLASKRAVETLPVLPVVFLQVLASTTVTWVVALGLRRSPPLRDWVRLGIPGVFQPGLTYMLTFAGLAITPVGVGGLLFAFETVVIVLLAWPLLGEQPTRATLVSTVVSTFGVVLLTQAAAPFAAPPLLGVLLILCGVTAAALDTLATRHLAASVDPVAMTAAVQVGALATVALSAPFWHASDLPRFASLKVLLPILASGIVIHSVGTLLFIYGLRRLTAGVTATLFPLTSLLTVVGGLVWFDEMLTTLQVAGGALVLGSALVTARFATH